MDKDNKLASLNHGDTKGHGAINFKMLFRLL